MRQVDFRLSQQKGFTLVEILAVLFVFAIIGGIVAQILITSLRTSKKSETIDTLKQNGNFALTQVAKTLRNARSIIISPYPCGPNSDPTVSNTITTTQSNGVNITFTCTTAQDTPPSTIASDGASLLNTTDFIVQPCQFTCSQTSVSDLPVVGLSFSLIPRTTSSFAENVSDPISFSTSVTIRNYNR